MKFFKPLFSFPPLWRLCGMALLYLLILFSGVYFLLLPSRIFKAKAVFRYYPENVAADAALRKPPGDPANLLEYYLENPALFENVRQAVFQRARLRVSPHALSRSLRFQKKDKEPEYAVWAYHTDPRRALAFLDAFLFTLIREVRESETGHLKNKKKLAGSQLLQAEKELAKLRKKINAGSGGARAKMMKDEIKRLQDEVAQLSFKKAESREVLRKLKSRFQSENPQMVSGTIVALNPAYKEAKFKLLDMQAALAKKKEDEKSTDEELKALGKQIAVLTAKINTRIPKYVEKPQVAANPVYDYLFQKILQQQMTGTSLSLRLGALQDTLKKRKEKILSSPDDSFGAGNQTRDMERLENKIYLLQGIIEDVGLELLRPDSIMVISRTGRASLLRPLAISEVLLWLSAMALVLMLIQKLASQMRNKVLDYPETLQSFEVPVLLHHSGREQDNVYVARTISYIRHEIPMRTLLFLASRAAASSAVCDIAVHLAKETDRVLLVDTDFYMPSLHGFFEVKNDSGLYSILYDEEIHSALPDQELIDKIERRILPVTAQCGFIGTGTGAPPRISLKEKMRKENLEAFVRAVKSSDVMLLFYATFDNNGSLDEFLPYIEGIVLCCPDGQEIEPKRSRFLSFLERAHHKVIGSVLFPRHVRSINAIPALFHTKS